MAAVLGWNPPARDPPGAKWLAAAGAVGGAGRSAELAEKLTGMLAGFLTEKLVEQLTMKPLGCAVFAAEVGARSQSHMLALAVCAADRARSHICKR